jgi:hypothetical protein
MWHLDRASTPSRSLPGHRQVTVKSRVLARQELLTPDEDTAHVGGRWLR